MLGRFTHTTVAIHHKNCPAEILPVLSRLEPEIQRAACAHGLTVDVCWERYTVKGDARDFYFFRLYAPARPDAEMGGDYGETFLRNVAPDEFYWWITRHLPHFG